MTNCATGRHEEKIPASGTMTIEGKEIPVCSACELAIYREQRTNNA